MLIAKEALAKLLSDHTAKLAIVKAELEKSNKTCKITMETERLSCIAKIGAIDHKLQICKDTNKISMSIYDSAMKRTVKSCQRSWYEHPLIVFGAGVAVCGASVGIGSVVR